MKQSVGSAICRRSWLLAHLCIFPLASCLPVQDGWQHFHTAKAALLTVEEAADWEAPSTCVGVATTDQAIRKVQPPQEVVDLLHRTKQVSNLSSVTEPEVEHVISILNLLLLKAQGRLDAKKVDCEVFNEKNAELLKQVQLDVDHVTQEQAGIQARLAAAREALRTVVIDIQTTKERQAEAAKHFNRSEAAVRERLSKAKNNLEVSEFILDLTKCEGTMMLGQTSMQALRGGRTKRGVEVCKKSASDLNVSFEDARLQNLTNRLTGEGQWQLHLALARSDVSSKGALSTALAMAGGLDEGETDEVDMTKPKKKDADLPHKCVEVELSCGNMYDTFAGVWGDLKDTVDDLSAQLIQLSKQREDLDASSLQDLKALTASKALLQAQLVDINSLQAEFSGQLVQKGREAAELKRFSKQATQDCDTVVKDITFSEMCAIKKVRSELLQTLSTLKGGSELEAVDCHMSSWRSSRCSVPCGGGDQVLTRRVVKSTLGYGAQCPALTMTRNCNQAGCPVDCKVSEWSEWSLCTRTCGGGVRARKRSREVRPKNGGFTCDLLQETQQCNTGACDSNCALSEWSEFRSCSQACDKGISTRRKAVVKPAVGAGRCPDRDSLERFDTKGCNRQKCYGDEVCLSKIDFVIAIDGSGSISESGFASLKSLASRFVARLKGGTDSAQVGVVQFGNGKLDTNKVVSDAIAVLPLTFDTEHASSTISGLPWRKGFTNLAQAAMKARDLLSLGRSGAEQVVILLTDGRPCFKKAAASALKELQGKARVMVVHVKPYPEKHNVELLKSYATEPAEVNYVHIQGQKALAAGAEAFATKLLVQACAKVDSPAAAEAAAQAAAHTGAGAGAIADQLR